jgi:hypothetical protein
MAGIFPRKSKIFIVKFPITEPGEQTELFSGDTPMISLRKSGLLATILFLSAAADARAYDEDTHFYGTYAMARHAGIKHTVAVKIALSAQWMDESFISDPTSMIFMPVTGVKKRRLLHFPSARKSRSNSEAERQVFGLNDLGEFGTEVTAKIAQWAGYTGNIEDINLFTTTEQDDPFASQMLFEGMQEGNLMKAATGLHTLEDSFAHEGTPAGAGHAMWWHWPDRPYASVDKYGEMTQAVFNALVGIRTLLPIEAIDFDLKTAGGLKNYEANAAQLSVSYMPLIKPVISHDVTRDPAYVVVALKEFYRRANEEKYISVSEADFNERVERLPLENGKMNAYDAVGRLFKDALDEVGRGESPIFNLVKITEDMRRLKSASATKVLDYADNHAHEGLQNWQEEARVRFAKVVAKEMLAWHVPADLNDHHRMEFEDDKDDVRKFEMEMRIRNMQAFIKKNFDVNLQFVENNSKDDRGFYHEIHMEPSAIPDYDKKPGFKADSSVVYATFDLEEKNKFDKMILSYLFPSMKPEDTLSLIESFAKIKKMLMQQSEYYAERKKVEESASNWIMKLYMNFKLDVKYQRYKGLSVNKMRFLNVALKDIRPLVKPLVRDLVTTHLEPSEDVFIYRRHDKFKQFISQGKAQQFGGDKDVWQARHLGILPEADTKAYYWDSIFK